MRYLHLVSILLCLTIVFSNCKKAENTTTSEEKITSLTGSWELYQTYSGMSPLITHASGKGNLLNFDSTKYAFYNGGQIVQQGSYQLVRDSIVDVNSCELLPPKDQSLNRILFDNTSNPKTFFEATTNTLKISSGCVPLDGGWSIYKRKKVE